MQKSRLILIMILCNLFFLGVLIGVNFFKQSIKSPSQPKIPAILHYQDLSNIQNIKAVSVRLKQSINFTGQKIHQGWSRLFNYVKSDRLLFKVKSYLIEKINFCYQVITSLKLRPSNTENNNKELVNSNHNQTSNFKLNSTGTRLPVTPTPLFTPQPTPVVGVDPFLTLVAKLQPKETPKIDGKAQVSAKLSTEEKPKATVTPKIEPTPLVEQKPKIEDKPNITKNLSKFHLRGIVIGSTPTAYIEGPSGYQKVSVGDSIDTGKIISINDDSITVQFEDEQVVLNVE